MNLTPERCPFLNGIDPPYRCDVTGEKVDSLKTAEYCFGNFRECYDYAEKILRLSLTVPRICPLLEPERYEADGSIYGKCKITGKPCEVGWINLVLDEDYRECDIFSNWFWETRKEVKK